MSETQEFALEGPAFDALRKVAALRGLTLAEALRFCIAAGRWWAEVEAAGQPVLTDDRKGLRQVRIDLEA